jgi:4a-hydroxytetrahydrobiopterin dehydratase
MKENTQISETELAQRDCKSCESGEGGLAPTMIKTLMNQLPGEWKLKDNRELEKSFKFPDFKTALDFTNRVGALAEEQGHHPDVFLTYGEVKLQLSTHEAKGVTENDFILAAKINNLT